MSVFICRTSVKSFLNHSFPFLKHQIPSTFALLTKHRKIHTQGHHQDNHQQLQGQLVKIDSDNGKPYHDDDHQIDDKLQLKRTNIGEMIDYLRTILPNCLTTIPEQSKIDESIQLRISPSIHPNVPIIQGQLKYLTSLKATQLIFKTFIVDSKTKLHVLNVEVDDTDKYGIYPYSTKLIIHWKSCDPKCAHLFEKNGKNLKAKDENDDNDNDNDNNNTKNDDDNDDLKRFRKTVLRWFKLGLNDNTTKNNPILFGIFVFELNEMNDKIIVHNVENLQVLDDSECVDNVGNFAID